jgi:hypothetical protein
MGRRLDAPSLDTYFEEDMPVTSRRAVVLANNVNHLRDTCTQQRVSYATYTGQAITATDFGGDAVIASPVMQFTTPWSILEGDRVARPVLRIGAHRNAAGTSYLSAGLFARGARQNASGTGALAYWPETSFTNTSAAIVIEAAADVTWTRPRRETRTLSLPGGRTLTQSRVVGSPEDFLTLGATDPIADGTFEASSPRVLMAVLAIWVRHTGTSETRISLVELREFSGP